MKSNIECIPCIINQSIKTCRIANADEALLLNIVKKVMIELQDANLDTTPPELSRNAWNIMNKELGNKDPYRDIKDYYNKEIMQVEPKLQQIVEQANDPFYTALKLVITGNIIDFGAKNHVDKDLVLKMISEVKNAPLIIDHSQVMFDAISRSQRLLYIGDNAGEIVFDKVFIKFLKTHFTNLHVTFAVRGAPIINDVTREDAIITGIDKWAEIIDSNDNTPGTVLEKASKEFVAHFNRADVIIAKGQGNFESLSNIKKTNLFHLFMAKCKMVAEEMGVEQLSLVCKRSG